MHKMALYFHSVFPDGKRESDFFFFMQAKFAWGSKYSEDNWKRNYIYKVSRSVKYLKTQALIIKIYHIFSVSSQTEQFIGPNSSPCSKSFLQNWIQSLKINVSIFERFSSHTGGFCENGSQNRKLNFRHNPEIPINTHFYKLAPK